MQGENGHMRWEWSCKVGMVTQCDFSGVVEGTPSDMHARWEWSCKVDTRWEWSHEVNVRLE